jgi:indolepyruvate ferredoxin oxidoreductase
MTDSLRDRRPSATVSLEDKWTINDGRILLSGTQAIPRVLLAQSALDQAAGMKTAGYITGYRGSPLGNLDMTLWSISKRLDLAGIHFVPGINEDIAATAIRGTQQLAAVPGPLVDGVFAAWYGKGPGVDRSGDALKHGNFLGAHRNGGVLVCYGDDHAGKSSSVAHHSEQAMAAAMIPSLYPSCVGEILEFGLMAYALSRYSGSWIGLKLVNEVVEQTATVDIKLHAFAPVLPPGGSLPLEGVHCRTGAFSPLREEEIVCEYRLPLVQGFVRANKIDRTAFRSATPRLGLVTAGKSYGDTRQALALLGLDDQHASRLGISLYKVGCIWPLEPHGISEFVQGHDTIFVIEEKASFVELQSAAVLVNLDCRPSLIGKFDEAGEPLLSRVVQLEPIRIALAIAGRLHHLGVDDASINEAAADLAVNLVLTDADEILPKRTPYFCSGCPHNRSTKIPDDSLSMSGIGCHTMAAFVRPKQTLLPTQMGGEGGNWIGLAPFTGTTHMFQNMGDGTYYHSGLLAIRAAVAAGVNITYKILYNDAVAMTGGQSVDGPLSVVDVARQVLAEGVKSIVLVSDNPDIHRKNSLLPKGVRIEHRDRLELIQRQLRALPGCTVLIYEQTCAAELRRRRKRGTYPDPPKRLFISEAVCEGCGDCSVQSTCVSLTPHKTEFGTKRKIDQSSCNKDLSCLNGFCPSFITVRGAEALKPRHEILSDDIFQHLSTPKCAALTDHGFNILVAGVGGTGVTTVGAILGVAAHIEGYATSVFDMTGLAQKNGAVFSHIRIASSPDRLHAQKVGRGEADLLLAFDMVAGVSDEAATTLAKGRTLALVNGDVLPTAAFQFDRDSAIDKNSLISRLAGLVGEAAVQHVNATGMAVSLFGDSIAANLMMIGVAAQRSLLPVSATAIEQAVRLNNAAVSINLTAFHLGRLFAENQRAVLALLPEEPKPMAQTVDDIVRLQVERLTNYQDAAYAERYLKLIRKVRDAERKIAPDSEELCRAVSWNYGKLLAYKDEYEVARMLTSRKLKTDLVQTFGQRARYVFNLAPPIFGGKSVNGRPPKREFSARTIWPLLVLLAKAKGLRNTPFDPFGQSTARRVERQLVSDYETLVSEVIETLSPTNHSLAARILGLADSVRGYGPVKDAAVLAYRAALSDAVAQLKYPSERAAAPAF